MAGTWIFAVARRLVDRDTLELVVSPAVADLQFESARAGWAARGRGYRAVWIALAGALAHDLHADLRLLHDDAPTLVKVVLMQVAYYSCLLMLPFAGMTARELGQSVLDGSAVHLAAGVLAVVAVSAVPTVLCFWPRRRIFNLRD